MARSYHIYGIETFPDLGIEKSISVPSQLSFLKEIEVPDTTMTMINPTYHAGFSVCKVHHEIVVKIMGRVQDYTFTEFVRPFDFEAYVHRNLGFVAFRGKGDVVSDAVRVMNEKLNDFRLHRSKLDLRKLLPYVAYLKGAWFKMSNPNLASQALFGDHVDRDPSFDRAMKTGESMSNMMLYYEFSDELVLISLLSECGIVFYPNLFEEAELELVLEVKRSLLDLAMIA